MNFISITPLKIIKIFLLISVLYISADIPKLYFLLTATFLIFLKFEKLVYKNIDIYLVPLFVTLYYFEPLIWNNTYKYELTFLYIFWGVISLLVSLLIYNSLNKNFFTFDKIIVVIFIGSFLSLIIIFFTNIYLFDFPITRNGFIHPFTRVYGEYLFFNLDLLEKIRPVNIRSLYEIIELMFVISMLLISIFKKNNYIFIFFSIFFFILGCSFGSRLFVIFCISINVLFLIFQNKKSIFAFIIITNSVLFFNDVTIYSFIKTNNYIDLFKDKKTIFKKIKSHSQIYSAKIDPSTNRSFSLSEIEKIIEEQNIKKVFMEDNYITLNFEGINAKYYSILFPENYQNIEYFKNKNIEVKKNFYTNRFTNNVDTFKTSQQRFFNSNEIINMGNRPKIILMGFKNVKKDSYSKQIDDSDNFESTLYSNFYNKNSKLINEIYSTKQIIFHNLFLDSIYNSVYFGSLILMIIYFRIFYISLTMILKKMDITGVIFIAYFLYDQFFQTSLLTGKKSIFLFIISYLLLVKLFEMQKKNS
jgi:hypothetical protein